MVVTCVQIQILTWSTTGTVSQATCRTLLRQTQFPNSQQCGTGLLGEACPGIPFLFVKLFEFPQGWFLNKTEMALRALSIPPFLLSSSEQAREPLKRHCKRQVMGESEAGNGLYRGKPHQAINTSLCTKQNVDLSVYFSSLQECTRHGHLNSQDVCGRISTLTNKGTEAGDNGGFSAHRTMGLDVPKQQ